ncbi:MAG: hypothetical protein V4604_05500 [Bacteroidota bacterium]
MSLILWVVYTDSPCQKGGVTPGFIQEIGMFLSAISLLVWFGFDELNWFEKLLFAPLFAFVSVALVTIFVVFPLVDFLYGEKIWALWETKNRIFINMIHYGFTAALIYLFPYIYLKIRKRIITD